MKKQNKTKNSKIILFISTYTRCVRKNKLLGRRE